jgi:hypothetical protein
MVLRALLIPALVIPVVAAGASAPSRATVGCTERIETGRASAEQRREARRASIFLRDVRFWGLRQWRGHEFAPGSGPDGGDPVVKAAISVRSPGPTTVKVAPEDRGWVALDYDRERWRKRGRTVADGQASVRFFPCDPDTPRFSGRGHVGRWTGWAGDCWSPARAAPRCSSGRAATGSASRSSSARPASRSER